MQKRILIEKKVQTTTLKNAFSPQSTTSSFMSVVLGTVVYHEIYISLQPALFANIHCVLYLFQNL